MSDAVVTVVCIGSGVKNSQSSHDDYSERCSGSDANFSCQWRCTGC